MINAYPLIRNNSATYIYAITPAFQAEAAKELDMMILTAEPDLPVLPELAVIPARLLPEADIVCPLRLGGALSLVHTHKFAAVFIDGSMDISARIHEASPSTCQQKR